MPGEPWRPLAGVLKILAAGLLLGLVTPSMEEMAVVTADVAESLIAPREELILIPSGR
jgi:hypothetical protein